MIKKIGKGLKANQCHCGVDVVLEFCDGFLSSCYLSFCGLSFYFRAFSEKLNNWLKDNPVDKLWGDLNILLIFEYKYIWIYFLIETYASVI